MLLHPGMAAPHFTAQDLFGNTIDLSTLLGKPVLLSFFRNAACALCNLRVHHMIRQYPGYTQLGLIMIAVFESPREPMLAYVGRQDAPFPLLADPEARLYNLYGVETSAAKLAQTMAMPETAATVQAAAALGFPLIRETDSNFERMPADFLIGPDGLLLQAHYANQITDHLPFAVIEQQLVSLSVAQP